jgi:hypothetical protein
MILESANITHNNSFHGSPIKDKLKYYLDEEEEDDDFEDHILNEGYSRRSPSKDLKF